MAPDAADHDSIPPQAGNPSGIPVWPLLLIAVGIILLLQTTGVVSWDLWRTLWRFWPLILVAIGLNMLLGRRGGWVSSLVVIGIVAAGVGLALAWPTGVGSTVVTDLAEPLGDVRSLDVDIDFGPGTLTLGALPGASFNLVEGRFETSGRAARAELKRSGASAQLTVAPARGAWTGGSGRGQWTLALSPATRVSITLDAGASDVRLDLRDLNVGELDIDIGAADLEMVAPASAGHVEVRIDAGAASIQVTVPEGVAARIRKSSGLSSFDVDAVRFPLSDGVYVSAGYATAQNRVDLSFSVGAASVRIR